MPKFVSARAAKFADRMKFKRGKIMSSKRLAVAVVSAQRRKKTYGQSGPEMKFLDTIVSVTGAISGPTAAGSTASINIMAQGLTNVTRIGNKIDCKSIEFKGVFFQNAPVVDAGGSTDGVSWHWALVLDKEPEAGAIAVYPNIYTQPIPGNSFLGFRNIDHSDRFVVLRQGIVDLQPVVFVGGAMTVGSGDVRKTVESHAKIDINTKFIGIAAAQANVATNQLLMVLSCSVDDPDAQLNGIVRVRYTDE